MEREIEMPAYDINAEKSVKKHRIYYHVTHVKNIPGIRKNGLMANKDGYIFVFTDQVGANTIAINQCFLFDEYAIFWIDSKGVTGKIIMDRVAEFSAPYHRIIIQDKISKKYIEFGGSIIINPDEPTKWDLLLLKRMDGLSHKDAKKEFYKRRELLKS